MLFSPFNKIIIKKKNYKNVNYIGYTFAWVCKDSIVIGYVIWALHERIKEKRP